MAQGPMHTKTAESAAPSTVVPFNPSPKTDSRATRKGWTNENQPGQSKGNA